MVNDDVFLAEEWGQKNETIDCLSRLEQDSSILKRSVVDLGGTEFYALKYSLGAIRVMRPFFD